MDKIRISFFKGRFTVKPSKAEAAMLNDIIAGNIESVNRDNIRAFADQVGTKGCTFCPATFKGGERKKDNFDQQQLLTLDFDNKIPFEEVKNRADRYDLPVVFAYDALNSVDHNRYSVAFLNDAPVSDLKVAEAMQQALTTIYPEADPSCREDVTRVCYGGKGLLHFDDSLPAMNVESLFRNLTVYLKDKHGATNYRRKIAEFSKKTGIRLNDSKLLDVSVTEYLAEDIRNKKDDNILPKTTIISSYPGEKLSKHYLVSFKEDSTGSTPGDKKNSTAHRSYRSYDLGTLGSNCQLYREFESGDRRLTRDELVGLATSLVQVESGSARFKDILSSNRYYDNCPEKYSDWDFSLFYIRHYDPYSCDGYCPYRDQCHHGKNPLSTSKPRRHGMVKLANFDKPLCTVDEALEDFKRCLTKAIQADDTKWHVIKSQTALGKTQAILELLRDTGLRVLIAVPTNRLKRELCERAAEMGIQIIVSPSLHELKDDIPDDVWDDIDALYSAGKSPMARLNKAIAENDHKCAGLFKQYKRELDDFNNAAGHAITTHRRLSSIDVSKYDLVIIDEDIIYSTVIPSRGEISLSKLKRLRKKLAASGPLAAKIDKILEQTKKSEFFTLDEIDYNRAYADIKMAVNIPALCSATHFCYRKASDRETDLTEDCVSFVNPVEFKGDTKYIMLSATADKDICEYYFGEDNVKFYTCKEAKLTGTLNLYSDKTMSRACVDKDPSIIDRIKAWSKFEYTISFKKYRLNDLYFGNTAGCDHLKGKNIDVIGTPHQPEWVYKLFAYSLGFDVDAKLKPNTPVTHNGYRFRFTTYDDKVLRAIQFYMIESESEQAVGRARLLRKPCIVNHFTNFPLCQSTLKESEYDKEATE